MTHRTALQIGAIVALAMLAADAAVLSQDLPGGRTVLVQGREAVSGEVLVRFRDTVGSFEATRAAVDVEATEMTPVGRRGLRRLRARRLGTAALLARLRANPDVEFAEPNYIIRLAAVPNDPSFGNLWGLFNSGQSIQGSVGTAGADIDAPLAWDISTGTRSNVVGVIDTGIDYNHPDLAANIWTAPAPFSVTIGGVVITCAAGTHGFNAINNTCNPMDDHSHGTHVAGTIGAVGNNGVGIAGVNWTASMMGLKFLGASGSGTTSDAIETIEFAIQAKAAFAGSGAANVRVLSNSWGGGGFSFSLLDAINRANTSNMLFVAAAGNDALNNDTFPHYPSSYTAANVLSVASTTNRDLRSSFSNYGAVSVDLGAPGSAILSTVPNNGYSFFNGTSMATPHVSGAAALLLSVCDLNTAALKTRIMSQVTPVAAMSGLTVSGGRLNVDNAIRGCPPLPRPVPVIAGLSPSAAVQGTAGVAVVVTGSGFHASSIARLNGTSRATTINNPGSLTVQLTSADLAAITTHAISVHTPAPGGGTSADATFNVTPMPVVTVNGTAAATAVAPGSAMTIAVTNGPAGPLDWVTIVPYGSSATTYTGIWFLSGTPLPPSPGLASASFPIPAPAVEGLYEVRFLANGRYQRLATSGVITVVRPNPAPQLSAIAPASVAAGTDGVSLAITGSGFVASSLVRFNGVARSTTFHDQGRLTATLPAADLVSTGTHTITVVTPAPGGGTSTGATFTLTPPAPAPTAVSLSPAAIGIRSTPLTVTVTGTGFAGNSQLYLDGAARPTTIVSSTSLTAVLPPSDLATVGTRSLTVVTPAPGGGTSSALVLTVVGPTVTVNGTAGATSVAPGSAMTIAVANGPANPSDWVTYVPVGSIDTAYMGIWFLSGTSMPPSPGLASASFPIPAPAIEGAYEVRFLANGRYQRLATSGVITVVRTNAAPQLSAIAPTSVAAGTNGVSLVITGSGFVSASQVRFNGVARSTTFHDQGRLTATLPAADLVSTGTHTITVVTPAPGGGTSTGATFTLTPPAPAPTALSLSPPVTGIRSIPLTVTVTGTGFAGNSQLFLNGAARPTTVVSSTLLTAVLPPSDLATGGIRSFTVVTPAPGGGTSSPVMMMVLGPAVIVNSTSGPTSVAPGSAMTITVMNGPANPSDWVTLAPVGSIDTTYTGIWFLNGTSMPPSPGLANATFPIPAPAVEGTYEVRFLANGRYQRLATSGVITVVRPNPAPQLSAIAPASVAAGTPGVSLTITGSGFVASSLVYFKGLARATTFHDQGRLTAQLPGPDLLIPGMHTITVSTPSPGGGTSTGATFTLTPPPPAPTALSLAPATIGIRSTPLTVAVTGTGFAGNSQLYLDGAARPTTIVSATSLTAVLPATDLATAGSRSLTVVTPAPGGGTSSALTLSVVGPSVTVNGTAGATSLAPGSAMTIAVANGPANPSDWVTFVPAGSIDTAYMGIWFLSGTSMPPSPGLASATFPIPAPAVEGTYEVRFLANGRYQRLATSGVITVVRPNAAPQLSAIAPAAVAAGTNGVSLVITGSGFVASSQVQFNGVARPTTYQHSGRLTVTLPAADLVSTGTHTITVLSPAPGGGTSAGATFTLTPPAPAPGVSSLSPTSVAVGAASLVLTVTGTDFTPTSEVRVGGAVRPTTFVSSTSLMAAIPAADLAAVGALAITVTTPAPGGGTSGALPLAVLAPTVTVNGGLGGVSVVRGTPMTIAVANGPAGPSDWVTIVPVGSSATSYMGIWFLSGTAMPPSPGLASATFPIPAPATPGNYEVRFLANGRYVRLATSGVITVTP